MELIYMLNIKINLLMCWILKLNKFWFSLFLVKIDSFKVRKI